MARDEDVIRSATRADLPVLVALLAQLGNDTSGESYDADPGAYDRALEEVLADPRQSVFVVEREGALVATATLAVVPNVSHGGRPYAIIESVVVANSERGRGIGARLVQHLIDGARSAGCYKVALTSRLTRHDAHRFYERLGFRFEHKGLRIDL